MRESPGLPSLNRSQRVQVDWRQSGFLDLTVGLRVVRYWLHKSLMP